MNTAIRIHLPDAAVAELLEAVANRSAQLLRAARPEARYATLEQRRCAVGGMLELARRLNAQLSSAEKRASGSSGSPQDRVGADPRASSDRIRGKLRVRYDFASDFPVAED